MLYNEASAVYQFAGGLCLGASAGIILLLAAIGASFGGLKKAHFAVAGAAFLITASTAVWGLTTFASTNASDDAKATAYFEEYGLNISADQAEQIRDHHTEDHMMYLDVDGAATEILFRNIDGAVVAFTAAGEGTWVPMDHAR